MLFYSRNYVPLTLKLYTRASLATYRQNQTGFEGTQAVDRAELPWRTTRMQVRVSPASKHAKHLLSDSEIVPNCVASTLRRRLAAAVPFMGARAINTRGRVLLNTVYNGHNAPRESCWCDLFKPHRLQTIRNNAELCCQWITAVKREN